MKIGIGYLRVSTPGQVEEGDSLEDQERRITETLKSKGCTKIIWFADKGITGTKLKPRIGIQNAMEEAVKMRISIFLFYDVSRLARRVIDAVKMWELLVEENGIELNSVTTNFSQNYEGKMLFTILAATAEFQSSQQGAKIKSVMESMKINGKFPHNPPRGYKTIRLDVKNYDGKRKPAYIVPDPETGHIYREMFEKYADNTFETQEECANFLIENGITEGPRGGEMNKKRISVILKNRFYAGYFWHKRENRWQKHIYETLMSLETERAIRAKLKRRARQRKSYKKLRSEYPLRSITYCQKCGNKIDGYEAKGNGGKYQYYGCKTPKCFKITQTKEIHKEYIENVLTPLIPEKGIIELLKEICIRKYNDEGLLQKDRIETIKKDLKSIIEEQNQIEDTVKGSANTSSSLFTSLSKRHQDLEDKKGELEFELRQVKQKKDRENVEPMVDKAVKLLENPVNTWQNADIQILHRYQKWIFPQGIEYHPQMGFRTKELCLTYALIQELENGCPNQVDLTGIEPT